VLGNESSKERKFHLPIWNFHSCGYESSSYRLFRCQLRFLDVHLFMFCIFICFMQQIFSYLLTLCALQMTEETIVTSTRMSTASEDRLILSDLYISEHEECVELFSQWSELEQVNFVEKLLAKMCHSQLGQVDCFLRPMLQRDFISALPGIPSRKSSLHMFKFNMI